MLKAVLILWIILDHLALFCNSTFKVLSLKNKTNIHINISLNHFFSALFKISK